MSVFSPGLTVAFLPSLNLANVHMQVDEIIQRSRSASPLFLTTHEWLPVFCTDIDPNSCVGFPSSSTLGAGPSDFARTGRYPLLPEIDRYCKANVASAASAITTKD